MKISEQWLRTWVNPKIDSSTLAEQLTMVGLEVDATEPVATEFEGVVVGEVLSVEPHPDADKLRVTKVDVGDKSAQPLQIVCGAPNVAVGMKAPVAMVGAVLPIFDKKGSKDSEKNTEQENSKNRSGLKIKKSKLRGIESHGMLCGASEIDLTDNVDGLLELPSDAPVGACIRDYLDLDARIIDISITPNRGDCFSVRGIARELAVVNELNFQDYNLDGFIESHVDVNKPNTINAASVHVSSETNDCPRYLAQLIRGVDASAPSPAWLRRCLERSGLQTRSLLVDVTNFVMMYLGQPLHAFDADKIKGNITVRKARAGEKLTLLVDGQDVVFTGDELVIADDSGAIALAGIMGGLSTSITDATKNVLIESAYFDPLVIAGRARRFGLHTDASQRFERGVDFVLPAKALELATALISSLAGGAVHLPSVYENKAHLPTRSTIELKKSQVHARLGIDIDASTISSIFKRLGIDHAYDGAQQVWQATAPSHRYDIAIADDLIEEVARIYGYDNIPVHRPMLAMQLKPKSDAVTLDDAAQLLKAQGYFEAISFSFSDANLEKQLNPKAKLLTLANPISSELAVMRSTLLSSLLPCVRYNLNRQQESFKFFEYGLRFDGEQLCDLKQIPTLALVAVGANGQENWHENVQLIDFYDIKQDVELIFALSQQKQGVNLTFLPSKKPWLHPGQSADIFLNGGLVGYVGALHPSILDVLDLSKTWVAELDAQAITSERKIAARTPPRFFQVRRDIAVIVDDKITAAKLLETVRKTGGNLLTDTWVFDIYQGEHVPEGKKSVALALIWQDTAKTMEDKEVQSATDAVVTVLTQNFDAELRMS